MGVAAAAEYKTAFRKLFPPGDYWDRQLADPESDASLFCEAKLPEFIRFRRRMAALQAESLIETTEELVADWERVLLGAVFPGLSLNRRRLQLEQMWNILLNRARLQAVAGRYDLTIADVRFPYRPGFFGFSRFSASFIGSPAAFSVLFITVQQEDFRAKSWALITQDYPAKGCGRIRYGVDRLTYFPVSQLRLYTYAKLRESAAGFCKCGISRVFPRFDNCDLHTFAQKIQFFPRFEKVLINYMLREKKPFQDFERAITDILLANHIPYFFYEERTT